MELKPGYKQTEAGVIPEDWDVQPLQSLSTKIMVGIASAATHAYRISGVPMFRNQNIKDGWLDESDLRFLDPRFDEIFRGKRLWGGDLLTARTGYPGTTAVVPPEYTGAQSFTSLITRPDASIISPDYLCLYINSPAGRAFFEQSQIGGAQKNVNANSLKRMPVAFPREKEEQTAIAHAVAEIDALIASIESLLLKKLSIKQATMQELLTGKRRLPGFEGEWEVRRLGDHVRFLRNGVNSRAELKPEGRIRYLHYGDIHASGDSFLSPEQLANLPVTKAAGLDRLQNGDLIFADASEDIAGVSRSVELSGISNYEAVSGLHTIAARFDKAVLADGFKGFLQYIPSFSAHLRRLAAGTKVYATNRAHILSAEVLLPPVAEQKAIADVLMDMSNEIGVLRERKDKACFTKQGMMQQLLTGKIRLQ